MDKLKAQVDKSVATLQHNVKKVKDFANPCILKTWITTEIPLMLHTDPQILDTAANDSIARKSDLIGTMVLDAITANLNPGCKL